MRNRFRSNNFHFEWNSLEFYESGDTVLCRRRPFELGKAEPFIHFLDDDLVESSRNYARIHRAHIKYSHYRYWTYSWTEDHLRLKYHSVARFHLIPVLLGVVPMNEWMNVVAVVLVVVLGKGGTPEGQQRVLDYRIPGITPIRVTRQMETFVVFMEGCGRRGERH